MARIIEGERKLIKLSTDDIIAIVREYQQLTRGACCYEHIRELLRKANLFLPADL